MLQALCSSVCLRNEPEFDVVESSSRTSVTGNDWPNRILAGDRNFVLRTLIFAAPFEIGVRRTQGGGGKRRIQYRRTTVWLAPAPLLPKRVVLSPAAENILQPVRFPAAPIRNKSRNRPARRFAPQPKRIDRRICRRRRRSGLRSAAGSSDDTLCPAAVAPLAEHKRQHHPRRTSRAQIS